MVLRKHRMSISAYMHIYIRETYYIESRACKRWNRESFICPAIPTL